jgi:hypothetical protein
MILSAENTERFVNFLERSPSCRITLVLICAAYFLILACASVYFYARDRREEEETFNSLTSWNGGTEQEFYERARRYAQVSNMEIPAPADNGSSREEP